MEVNLTVQAHVINIKGDRPQPNDIFMVDTNAWYWLVYSRYSQSVSNDRLRQTGHYQAYIQKAIETEVKQLHYCGLTLSELAHNIEKVEQEIFSRNTENCTPKQYRHNYPAQRNNVIEQVEVAWSQLTAMGTLVNLSIDEETINAALNRFQSQQLDGYDLFMLEAMRANSIQQIITDDQDFATVPGIVVFTANNNVIESARAQGKLVNRSPKPIKKPKKS
jgi:predicted nucleic acid-binding protein